MMLRRDHPTTRQPGHSIGNVTATVAVGSTGNGTLLAEDETHHHHHNDNDDYNNTNQSLSFQQQRLSSSGSRMRRRKQQRQWDMLSTVGFLLVVTCCVLLYFGTTIHLHHDVNLTFTTTTSSTDTSPTTTTSLSRSRSTTTDTSSRNTTTIPPPIMGLMSSTTTTNPNSTPTAITQPNNNTTSNYHLVFSTGCSSFQDWQSYAFFYHIYKIGQIGHVTRIVSGCKTWKQMKMMKELHRTQIVQSMSSTNHQQTYFHIHFTPDYSQINIKGREGSSSSSSSSSSEPYKYFNKPFGMKHWMEHKLGYAKNSSSSNGNENLKSNNNKNDNKINNPNDDTIIILLDPDQLLLRPFVNDYSNLNMEWTRRGSENISKLVQHGKTLAQNYNFGDKYVTNVNLTHVLLHEEEEEDDEEEKKEEGRQEKKKKSSSPLWSLNKATLKKFAAGPPYIATAKDMFRIVTKWSELVVRVHDVYPKLMAEMYAYSLATIQVGLRPFTAAGFMVSYERLTTEGWYWIEDRIPPITKNILNRKDMLNMYQSVCPPKEEVQPPPQDQLPFVLHYCQRYGGFINGTYYFSKYEMHPGFLSCRANLLREFTPNDFVSHWPSSDENGNENGTDLHQQQVLGRLSGMLDVKYRIRNAWVMCNVIPALNEVAEFFKKHHCPNNSSTNYDKVEWFGKIPVSRFNS